MKSKSFFRDSPYFICLDPVTDEAECSSQSFLRDCTINSMDNPFK